MDSIDEIFLNEFSIREKQYDEIQELLSSVEIMMDNKLYVYYQKKQKEIENIALMYKEYNAILEDIKINNELTLIEDTESMKNELTLANKNLQDSAEQLFNKMKNELVKIKDSQNQRVSIEINIKQGDSEFLNNIVSMFENYAEQNKSNVSVKSQKLNSTILEIIGDNIYNDLNIFSGNTKIISAGNETIIGITVLNIKDNTYELKSEDILVETLKADGAGGQHINKTESAVRLVHIPTGIVSVCKDERSQVMNKKRAMENLEKKICEKFSKESKNDIEIQRNNIKNALFSTTPVFIINFDRNIIVCLKTKKEYKLKEILNGDLKLISSDVIVNGK